MNFIFNEMMSLFSSDLAIDLGTADTRVYFKSKGIILHEPSVVAVRTGNRSRNSILAVSLEAKDILGRASGHINVIAPCVKVSSPILKSLEQFCATLLSRLTTGANLSGRELLLSVFDIRDTGKYYIR